MIAEFAQDRRTMLAYTVVVVDHEDRFPAMTVWYCALGGIRLRLAPCEARQIELHGCPFTQFAVDLEMAAGLFGESVHLRAAEACTMSRRLLREERLEYSVEHVVRNS